MDPTPSPPHLTPPTNPTPIPPSYSHYDSDPLLPSATPSPDPAENTLRAVDRDSAIALGVLLLAILSAIFWIARTRIKQRREQQLDLEQNPPRTGIFQTRIFRVHRKDARAGSNGSTWPCSVSVCQGGGESGRASISTLPEYTAQSREFRNPFPCVTVDGSQSQREERRWWGSVAAHGSSAKADRAAKGSTSITETETGGKVELPPLPPSPTLVSLSGPVPGFPLLPLPSHSSSLASLGPVPRFNSRNAWHDLNDDPRNWIDAYGATMWRAERSGEGTKDGFRGNERRDTSMMGPLERSDVRDWAARKV